MNEKPKLSMGAAVIDFPSRVDMLKPSTITNSKTIHTMAKPNDMHLLRQHSKINLIS